MKQDIKLASYKFYPSNDYLTNNITFSNNKINYIYENSINKSNNYNLYNSKYNLKCHSNNKTLHTLRVFY